MRRTWLNPTTDICYSAKGETVTLKLTQPQAVSLSLRLQRQCHGRSAGSPPGGRDSVPPARSGFRLWVPGTGAGSHGFSRPRGCLSLLSLGLTDRLSAAGCHCQWHAVTGVTGSPFSELRFSTCAPADTHTRCGTG
jgi:hypothetical protein